jgi:superfamily II DNA or RNA helicase
LDVLFPDAFGDSGIEDRFDEEGGDGPLTEDAHEPSELVRGILPDPAISQWLLALSTAVNPLGPIVEEDPIRIYYLLARSPYGLMNEVTVKVVLGRDEDGEYVVGSVLKLDELRRIAGSRHDRAGDADAIRSLERYGSTMEYMRAAFRLSGRDGSYALSAVAQTGRILWTHDEEFNLLALGERRPFHPTWTVTKAGRQALQLVADCHTVLPLLPPWYVDLESGECGPLDPGVTLGVYSALLATPEIPPEQSETVRRQLERLLPNHPELLPDVRSDVEIRVVSPKPKLTVSRKSWTEESYRYHRRGPQSVVAPVAKLEFYYNGTRAKANDTVIRMAVDDRVVAMPRQHGREADAWDRITDLGWRPASDVIGWQPPKGFGNHLALVPDGDLREPVLMQMLFEFLEAGVPELEAEGWDVQIEGDPVVIREDQYQWQIDASADDRDWFNLELGILVEGRRVPLHPILAAAVELARRRTPGGSVDDLRDEHKVFHQLPDGKVLALPVARLKPLFRTLTELFGPLDAWGDVMRLPTLRASDVAELDNAARRAGLVLRAPERLLRISARLAQFEQIPMVALPPTFTGELRAYQASGVAWLQFLRELEFGGILADDMGLGKTVQTLAHICVEHAAGRLDRPALIVAPTSTLPNWRHEVRRFAPSLRLLTLHGAQRAKNFGSLDDYDVVLTSYPLLARDRDTLQRKMFHLVVLDEAQNIKNPATAMAKSACALKARHRLCLSGTPVENNLEELWSLFHFLSPGLLGPITDFRRDFRVPIERQSDAEAGRRLGRRTRPFILRRTKELVAPELPAKTEFVEYVELDGPQRDLYEGVRLAMDERVRDLLATKGLQRSRIEVLEALLKLRQVCCDPRLVKLPSADEVHSSAKLERLLEMLDELREQGRSVLIFSQFTSMLDLIELELRQRGMEWVRISGDTDDRDTPVRRFQAGEVRLFLISLKAGGTGLNLTAADTVIHYDPWWNPAVERQATDRAHRIGQTKSVFVYKLVAEGTVEEKILELQSRKGQLAASILDGESDLSGALTAEDLNWILEA